MRIDNNQSKYVIAFLGDLGRDLPETDRAYWKSYNVVPDGTISDVTYRRGFLAEFAEPEIADLRFKSRFKKFQTQWNKKYGWYFFKPLAEEDQHYFAILRIPLKNNQREFDEMILALTKTLIDSINEAELQKIYGSFPDKTQGISKLEMYLSREGFPDPASTVKFLRNLQDLRSSGTAHRKSDNYRKIAQTFGIGEKDLITVFEDILNHAIEFLQALSDYFLPDVE